MTPSPELVGRCAEAIRRVENHRRFILSCEEVAQLVLTTAADTMADQLDSRTLSAARTIWHAPDTTPEGRRALYDLIGLLLEEVPNQ